MEGVKPKIEDRGNALQGKLNPNAAWSINFWLGAWDRICYARLWKGVLGSHTGHH